MTVLIQRPNTARARPSTLLENDASYEKLFHGNNALQTYYFIASWGRGVELRLKNLKKYEVAENSGIKFYVLYYLVCGKVSILYPSSNQIEKINELDFSENDIDMAINICYDI